MSLIEELCFAQPVGSSCMKLARAPPGSLLDVNDKRVDDRFRGCMRKWQAHPGDRRDGESGWCGSRDASSTDVLIM